MGLRHLRGGAWAVCLASAAALGALQAGAQQPVEELTVVGQRGAGQMYRELHRQTSIDDYCATISHSQPWCPQYQGGVGGPGMPGYGPSNQPCSGTDNVTPHCRCGSSAPRKVYDASTGKFHCRAKPPTAPCSTWDHAFSYDPAKWKCETRPFDNAMDDAERVKNCVGGVVSRNWSRFWNVVTYGSPGGNWGAVGCQGISAIPNVSVSTFILNDQLYTQRSGSHASPWQYMMHTEIHEALHVRDFYKYQRCDPWNDDTMKIMLGSHGFPKTYEGYEDYTHQRTLDEYETQLGVYSPRDSRYKAKTDRDIQCSLQ